MSGVDVKWVLTISMAGRLGDTAFRIKLRQLMTNSKPANIAPWARDRHEADHSTESS